MNIDRVSNILRKETNSRGKAFSAIAEEIGNLYQPPAQPVEPGKIGIADVVNMHTTVNQTPAPVLELNKHLRSEVARILFEEYCGERDANDVNSIPYYEVADKILNLLQQSQKEK